MVGGSDVSVVSATVTTVITIDGTAATVYPGYTGVIPAFNNLSAWGFPSLSTHTDAPPPTKTTSTSPTPSPTALVVIAYWTECDFGGVSCDDYWTFYNPPVGSTDWSVCTYIGEVDSPDNININDVPFPSGTINYTWEVDGISGCSYTGTSTSAGTMDCPGFAKPVQCFAYSASQVTCNEDDGQALIVQKVGCQWG